MADNKLSWTELRRVLMDRAGVSEKDATGFLNAFQSQLIEALKQDKQARINGLGTFRLQPVAARKSVDVSSGEEIIIDGYNKIIFAPEAGVRELVEKVADVSSEPAEIDPIQKLGVQAEEIKDILGELGQNPEEQEEEPEIPEEPVAEEPQEEEPEPEPEPEQEPEPEKEPEPVVINETNVYVQEPVFVSEPAFVPEPKEPEPEFDYSEPKKESHWFRNLLIILLILLLIAAICAYFFLPRPLLNEWKDKALSWWPWSGQTEQVVQPEDEGIDSAILAEYEAICGDDEEEEWDEIVYDQLITTERMHFASRLAWMSYRFYGDKRYWPYLYDANKDHLDDPNNIDVGTPIRVPKLTADQRDLGNETTRRHLEYLKRRAELKMK